MGTRARDAQQGASFHSGRLPSATCRWALLYCHPPLVSSPRTACFASLSTDTQDARTLNIDYRCKPPYGFRGCTHTKQGMPPQVVMMDRQYSVQYRAQVPLPQWTPEVYYNFPWSQDSNPDIWVSGRSCSCSGG